MTLKERHVAACARAASLLRELADLLEADFDPDSDVASVIGSAICDAREYADTLAAEASSVRSRSGARMAPLLGLVLLLAVGCGDARWEKKPVELTLDQRKFRELLMLWESTHSPRMDVAVYRTRGIGSPDDGALYMAVSDSGSVSLAFVPAGWEGR